MHITNIIKKHPNMTAFFFYILFGFCFFSYAFIKGSIILNGDTWAGYYPFKLYYASFLQNGFSLWLPYIYMGMPMLGELQTALLYPLNFIYFLISTPLAFNLEFVIHYSLAGFFTFLYLRAIGIRKIPSFLAGIAFSFSGFMLSKIVYVSIQNAATWAPLLVFLYEKMRQTLKVKYSIWAGIVIAIQIFAGHFQISFYTYMLLGFFVLFYLWSIDKKLRLKYLLLSACPIALGVLLALPQLVATVELTQYSSRAKMEYSYFASTSLHPFSLLQLIFPSFFGLNYGDEMFSWKYYYSVLWALWEEYEFFCYSGILTLLLAMFTSIKLFKYKNKNVLFWTIVCIFSMILALGGFTPLYKLMYHVPVYNLFRIPARHLMEFCLALAVLFGIGLHDLIYTVQNKKIYRCLSAIIAVLALSIATIAIIIELKFKINLPYAVLPAKETMFRILTGNFVISNISIYIPLCLMVLYSFIIFLFSTQFRKNLIIFLLFTVFFTDIFLLTKMYSKGCTSISDINTLSSNAMMSFVKSNAQYNRVAFSSNSTFPLYFLPLNICAFNGFDPLAPDDFIKLTDNTDGTGVNWNLLLKNNILLSTLNIKYFYLPTNMFKDTKAAISTSVSSKAGLPSLKKIDLPLIQPKYTNIKTNSSCEYAFTSTDNSSANIEYKTTLKPNTVYMYSFDIKSPNSPSTIAAYLSNTIQPLLISKSEIKRSYTSHFKLVTTGSTIDKSKFIISSNDKGVVYIKNVHLYELKNYSVPVLGKTPSGSAIYKQVLNNASSDPNSKIQKIQLSLDDAYVYENMNCLPKAFPVEKLEAVSTIEDVKYKFLLLKFNPAKTALVYNNDLKEIGQRVYSSGNVSITSYKPDKIDIKADFKGTGFLVLAEQYYPGWKALIDGKETKIYAANGIERGIVVPKGSHSIVFKYTPINVYISAVVSIITLVFCICCLIYIYKKEKTLSIKMEE